MAQSAQLQIKNPIFGEYNPDLNLEESLQGTHDPPK